MSDVTVFDGIHDKTVYGRENSGLDFIERYKEIRNRLYPQSKPVHIPQKPVAEVVRALYAPKPKGRQKPYAPRNYGVGENLIPSSEIIKPINPEKDQVIALRAKCLAKSKELRDHKDNLTSPILSDADIAHIVASKPDDMRVSEYVSQIVETRHGFSLTFFAAANDPSLRSKSYFETQARQEFAYILTIGFGWSLLKTGNLLGGIDHSTVSHCKRSYRAAQKEGIWPSTRLIAHNIARLSANNFHILKKMHAGRAFLREQQAARKANEGVAV